MMDDGVGSALKLVITLHDNLDQDLPPGRTRYEIWDKSRPSSILKEENVYRWSVPEGPTPGH